MKKPMKTKHYTRQCQLAVAGATVGVTPHSLPLNGASVRRRSPFSVFLLLLVLCFALFAVSCSGEKKDDLDESDDSGSTSNNTSSGDGAEIVGSITGASTTRSMATIYNGLVIPDSDRSHYGLFDLSIDEGTATFVIAARKGLEPKPSAEDIKNASATITRTLSSEAITVYIPFHMDSTYFDTLKAANIQPDSANILAELDAVSVGDLAAAADAMLEPITDYKLYATKKNGDDDTVHELLDFRTDAEFTLPSVAAPSNSAIWGIPHTSITVRADEYTFFRISAHSSEALQFVDSSNTLASCGSSCPLQSNDSAKHYRMDSGFGASKQFVFVVKSFAHKPAAIWTIIPTITTAPKNDHNQVNLSYQ